MGIQNKSFYIIQLTLVLWCTNFAFAQSPEAEPQQAADEKTAKVEESVKQAAIPDKLIAPEMANLPCPETQGISPYLSLSAKAKLDKKYQTLKIGCIDLAESDALLTGDNEAGLDQLASYILDSKYFIRMYIDLEDAQTKDQALLKRFRTKAFAVRNILNQKGVYDHLKANREGVFPSKFTKKEPEKKPVKKMIKIAKKPPKKTKTKPRDPLKDYTFQIERKDIVIPSESVGIYGDHSGERNFQFIPAQSIYFPHDKYELTTRAQATLLAMVDYILNTPQTNKLIIQSHTDEVGTQIYNFRLADRRALVVRDFIIENGVPEDLIEIISRGETTPVDENWTRQGKSRNRRVELYIIQRNTPLTTTSLY